jgi:hypothetical protein
MLQLVAAPNLDLLQDVHVQTFAVEYSSQHISCPKCCKDNVSLNAPSFVFSDSEGVNKFTFPPITGWEMGALALFFKTAGHFPRAVVFDHIPGFRVISETTGDAHVSLEFYADSKLLNFMGINDSLSWLTIKLHANQLEELAELILDSAANCK